MFSNGDGGRRTALTENSLVTWRWGGGAVYFNIPVNNGRLWSFGPQGLSVFFFILYVGAISLFILKLSRI